MRYVLIAFAVLSVIGGVALSILMENPYGVAAGVVSAIGYLAVERVIHLLEEILAKMGELNVGITDLNSTARQGAKILLGQHLKQ